MNGKVKKHRSVISVIARGLAIAVIIFVIGVVVYCLYAKYVRHEKMPMPFNHGIAVVLSGSMEPTLSVDDMIIVEKTDDYEVGDVVMYQGEVNTVTHRIVEINGDEVITKGDANNTTDEPIEASRIKGEVVGKLPRWLGFLQNPRTPSTAAILIAVILVIISLSRSREEDAKADMELEAIRAEIRRLRGEKDAGKKQ